MKLLVFALIGMGIIFLAVMYGRMRKEEFRQKSQVCAEECKEKGYQGWDYKLGGFSEGQCQCLQM